MFQQGTLRLHQVIIRFVALPCLLLATPMTASAASRTSPSSCPDNLAPIDFNLPGYCYGTNCPGPGGGNVTVFSTYLVDWLYRAVGSSYAQPRASSGTCARKDSVWIDAPPASPP